LLHEQVLLSYSVKQLEGETFIKFGSWVPAEVKTTCLSPCVVTGSCPICTKHWGPPATLLAEAYTPSTGLVLCSCQTWIGGTECLFEGAKRWLSRLLAWGSTQEWLPCFTAVANLWLVEGASEESWYHWI